MKLTEAIIRNSSVLCSPQTWVLPCDLVHRHTPEILRINVHTPQGPGRLCLVN